MSIKEHICPNCGRTLQSVATPMGAILACPCGYSVDVAVEDEVSQLVLYENTLGLRSRMTSLTESKRQ